MPPACRGFVLTPALTGNCSIETTRQMKISVFPRPIVKREAKTLFRRLDVECVLMHGLADAEWVVSPAGKPAVRVACAALAGRARQTLWLPEPTAPVQVKVELRSGTRVLAGSTVKLAPCRPWHVHLLHQSHFDYGYTTLQSEILRLQTGNLDTALDDIEEETRGRLKKFTAFWPDWWNEGLGSMARDFAMHRRTQERVEFSETARALGACRPAGGRSQSCHPQLASDSPISSANRDANFPCASKVSPSPSSRMRS